jgi:hypothetical protein
MPLESLTVINSSTMTDLSVLSGLPLKELNLSSVPVTDLTPLKDLPLESLTIQQISVSDITPLANLKLKILYILGCPEVKNAEATIRQIKTLEKLTIPKQVKTFDFVKELPNLKILGQDGRPGKKGGHFPETNTSNNVEKVLKILQGDK